MNSNFDDVGEFHEKFGLDNTTHHPTGPREIDDDLMGFRLNFLLEELTEIVTSAGYFFQPEYDPIDHDICGMQVVKRMNGVIDHALVFDGLLDLAYVTFGLAHLQGYPWQAGWNLVQMANMAKERARKSEQSKRGGTWDVIKPVGWTPPRIEQLLAFDGWDIKTYTNKGGPDLPKIGIHTYEVFEGASGQVCTATILRDGHGDQCGLPADAPIHTRKENQ